MVTTERVGNVTMGTITGLTSSSIYTVTVTPFSNENKAGFAFGNIQVTTSAFRDSIHTLVLL